MLATFVFLLVTILITLRMEKEYELPKLRVEVENLRAEVKKLQGDNNRLVSELGDMVGMSTESQMTQVLSMAGLDDGSGRHDFDLFVKGLEKIPGEDLHILVDATGSMHGVATFLIPVLRVIVIRSKKDLVAVTWFSDGNSETYTGTMGEMFDLLMQGAPFIGSNETIGKAFKYAVKHADTPGAYLLIGDEPSDDRIYYESIPAPVFTLPLGRSDSSTLWEYERLAKKTDGLMLHVNFR